MDLDCRYGFGRQLPGDFASAVSAIITRLEEQGFGIHSRINMVEVLGEEHATEFRNYLILGACRSDFARRAFNADRNIGLLLPCNVVVYEDMAGQVTVMVKDPVHIMDLVSDPRAIEAAIDLKSQLESIIEAL